MARVDLTDNVLNQDQQAFLLGTLVGRTVDAGRKRRVPGFSILGLIGVARGMRAGKFQEVKQIAESLNLSINELQTELNKFEPMFKAQSRRYLVGEQILAATTLPQGIIGAQRLMWTFRRPGNFLGEQLARHQPLILETRAPNGDANTLEAWDDSDRFMPPTDLEVGEPTYQEVDSARRIASETLLAWDDIPSWQDDVATEPGLEDLPPGLQTFDDEEGEPFRIQSKNTVTTGLLGADHTTVSNWLSRLGVANSGVNIGPLADRIVARLSFAEAKSIAEGIGRGNTVLDLLNALTKALRSYRLTNQEQLYLRRLVAVVKLHKTGFRFSARRAISQYVPVPGKIFYLIHMRDPFEVNGYVSRSHLLMSSIAAAGFDPIAVTRLGFPQDLQRHRNAIIAEIEEMEGHPVIALQDGEGGQTGRPLDDYINAYADRIIALAMQHRPTLLHAASNHLNGLAAIRASRQLGIPCVYEVRGVWEITQASANELYASTIRYELQRTLENDAVRAADRVITISEPLRQFVIEHGARDKHVSVVPNGVNTALVETQARDEEVLRSLGIDPADVVIGYVGSIVRYEGLDYLIEAVWRLRNKGLRGFRLLIVGDGKELAALRNLAKSLEVDEICIFTGRIRRDRVLKMYSAIDIVPLPRRSLAVTELVPPLKPFEAMAAGKAVIVSSVRAVAGTVIHEQTGLIVEKDNVDDLAHALERLIADSEMRSRMGQVARAWVEQERSLPALAKQISSVYESLGVCAI